MDKITRCITSDGGIMAAAIDSSDIVFTAQQLHGLTKTTSAALGRLLTGTSLMGTMLKNNKATVTITINGGGPIGNLIARSDSHGNVKGYVSNPTLELPIRADGKIDVGGAVGFDGRLSVVRDEGEGEPYIGQVELVSGEIAEDLTTYYAQSEQIPTICALGVLVDKDNGKVLLAGGMLIQLLPGAEESAITRLEENFAKLDSVTTMLAKGISPKEMCEKALDGFEVEVLDEYGINYVCDCSKEKFSEMLLTLAPEEIETLPLVKENQAEIVCPFCSRAKYFTSEELREIADEARKTRGSRLKEESKEK